MTTPTIAQGLRPLTDTEARAVAMFEREEPMELIAVETGLTRAQIAAAVGQARELAKPPATPVVPAPRPAPAATPAQPRPAAPAPIRLGPAKQTPTTAGDVQYWEIEDLLKWADDDGRTRSRSLAARIRLAANELRDLAGRGEAVRQAEDEVQKLKAKLAAAQEALRLAQGKKLPAAQPAVKAATSNAEIRAWAAENGIECAPNGKLPARVIEAWTAAHPGGSDG